MYTLLLPSLALLLMAPLPSDLPQIAIAEPGARDICASVANVELPAEDRPSPDERRALSGCVSLDQYFGFGVAPDPVKARKCAYLEMDAAGVEPVLGGRAVLMMAYANGKGAARDYDVALKMACAIGGAPQDIAGRVHHLARLKAARWNGDTFSICDHSSGDVLYRQCAVLQERFDAPVREAGLRAIVAQWKAPEQAAFAAFRRDADSFFQAHASKEANLDSTVEVHERAFLEDSLIESLRQFERSELPRFTTADLRQAEAAMNAAYTRTQGGTTRQWGTATSDGIRDTQQAWVRYRDAWLAFAQKRYPSASAASWKTWLTETRTEMLNRFPTIQ